MPKVCFGDLLERRSLDNIQITFWPFVSSMVLAFCEIWLKIIARLDNMLIVVEHRKLWGTQTVLVKRTKETQEFLERLAPFQSLHSVPAKICPSSRPLKNSQSTVNKKQYASGANHHSWGINWWKQENYCLIVRSHNYQREVCCYSLAQKQLNFPLRFFHRKPSITVSSLLPIILLL